MALLTLSASNYIGIVHSDPVYTQSEPIYAPSEPIYPPSEPIYAPSEPIYAPSEPNLCPKWTSKNYAQSELEFMPKVSPSPFQACTSFACDILFPTGQ